MKESKFYKIIRPIITGLFKFFYTPKIIGKENIPKEGRIILAGTHTNYLDCALLISSTKRNIHFLAKHELFKGIKGIIFSNLGLIPVNRKVHDGKAIKEAEKYLSDEKVIGIFPEGTIGYSKLLPFKKGAVKMAYNTNTKIIPFVIIGDYKLFSKNLKIIFEKPMMIEDNNFEKQNKILESKIKSMLEVNN